MKKVIWITWLALAAFSGYTKAATVALFADTNYVGYNPADSSDEASNMEASLVAQGHTVNLFTGVTTAEWSTALSGADLLVMPENENDSVASNLEAGAVTAIQDFVSAGGGLIIAQDYEDFLNTVFGYAISDSGSDPYDLVVANAAGTAFEGGVASLPYNDDTSSWSAASLPAGAVCMYENGSSDCVVFTVAYGSGTIVSLGWDFYDAAPIGSLDNGWISVLGSSVEQVAQVEPAAAPLPPEPPRPVPAVPLSGLAVMALGIVAVVRRRLTAR